MNRDKEFNTKLGFTLRNYRNKNNIQMREIAARLNITHQQIQKYETGKNRIPVSQFLRYCKILNLNPAEILNSIDYTLRGRS